MSKGADVSHTKTDTVARHGARVLVVLAALLVVSACGSDDTSPAADPALTASGSPSTSATESTSTAPDCATVWVDGQQLPAPYRGCQDGAKLVKVQAIYCSQGSRLVTFGRTFYAVPGKRVNEVATALAHDRTFQRAVANCTA
jgi:hypothetical protein